LFKVILTTKKWNKLTLCLLQPHKSAGTYSSVLSFPYSWNIIPLSAEHLATPIAWGYLNQNQRMDHEVI